MIGVSEFWVFIMIIDVLLISAFVVHSKQWSIKWPWGEDLQLKWSFYKQYISKCLQIIVWEGQAPVLLYSNSWNSEGKVSTSLHPFSVASARIFELTFTYRLLFFYWSFYKFCSMTKGHIQSYRGCIVNVFYWCHFYLVNGSMAF